MPNAPCILVVDDESLIRWAVRARLEQAGYRVLEAATGREALRHLQEGVDLVLLDRRLPDAEGLDVLRLIKKRFPACEVILMTAQGNAETAREAAQEGAYQLVGKPFDLDELARLVERAILQGRVA